MTTEEFCRQILRDFPHLPARDAAYVAERTRAGNRSSESILGRVTHFARHHYTPYDSLLPAAPEIEERETDNFSPEKKRARATVRPLVDAALEFWRTGRGHPPERHAAREFKPAATPLPARLEDCRTKTQAMKWLKNKYRGYHPHNWSDSQLIP